MTYITGDVMGGRLYYNAYIYNSLQKLTAWSMEAGRSLSY